MIAFFNGSPGAGKTYHATAYILYCLKHQLRVAASWDVVPPEGVRLVDLRRHGNDAEARQPDCTIEQANRIEGATIFRFDALDELFGLRHCQVFKDEAQNDLGSRDWEKMPLRVRIWMSEHRHYAVNLFLYTQHYKFVDIYPRRLGLGSVYSIVRLLNLTLEIPRPQADSETGELGMPDIFSTKIVWRPWRGVDQPVPHPGFFELLKLSRLVPMHYRTHAPHEDKLETKKKSPAASSPAAPAARSKHQVPLL